MEVAKAYFYCVAIIFSTCMGLFGAFVVNLASAVSLLQFWLMIFFTFSFSLTFTKRLFSLFVPPTLFPGSPVWKRTRG